MTGAVDRSGSESGHDRDILPESVVRETPSSHTKAYVPTPREQDSQFLADVDEHEKTIISQRPVAAPEEFYRSMPLAELATMLEGRQLDHFTVEQMVGGGGMGAVFRGKDERLDRTVAIKVIPASKRDPETLRRFRLEAQAAARLDHPNIARVYYVGEAEQWNYIVFEFIDGVNIRDLVEMEGPLSVDDAVFYTRQVAEALQHAHDRNVVHRDIKPSNVLVTVNGIAKVVDMGLARNTSLDKSTADATASGMTLGTFDYISPEQARNPRDADVRSDLYSLGCTLFFMLTGHPPFPEGTALQKLLNHGSQPPPDARGWREDLSDQLYAIIMKLMAKQPSHRYQKPAELINDLMLLAEVEDLKRSQSPGTLLLVPSVAQSSLLESNLPWMMALAFLLGSTLWLQVMPSGFALKELRLENLPTTQPVAITLEPESGRSSPLPELPQPLTNDTSGNGGFGRLPSEAVARPNPIQTSEPAIPKLSLGPLVVCDVRPSDVETVRWENSLQRALEKVQLLSGAKEIEIRGKIVLDRPIRLSGMPITLRSTYQHEGSIELSPSLLAELPDWSGAFELRNSSLSLSGVNLHAVAPNLTSNKTVGLVRLEGNASLSLLKCLVTIDGDISASKNVYAVLGDEVAQAAPETVGSTEPISPSSGKTLRLASDGTVIRGSSSFLGLRISADATNHVEVSITNSLIAVEGVGIDISHAIDIAPKAPRNVRVFCEESTFLTNEGFASLDFTAIAEPQLSLNRTSNKCVFASNRGLEHISLKGLNRESLFGDVKWFLLKGIDNAYDEKVNVLCRFYEYGEEISAIRFSDAVQETWYAELGDDFKVRWIAPLDPKLKLSELTPADVEVAEGMFSPGFRAESTTPPL